MRSPGSRFFSSPAFPESKVLFFWPNHLRCNNSGKGDNGLYIGSDSNYSASENIINQNNTNEPAQNPSKCINNSFNTPSPTWNCGSDIKTSQIIEKVYYHRTSSSPIMMITEEIIARPHRTIIWILIGGTTSGWPDCVVGPLFRLWFVK